MRRHLDLDIEIAAPRALSRETDLTAVPDAGRNLHVDLILMSVTGDRYAAFSPVNRLLETDLQGRVDVLRGSLLRFFLEPLGLSSSSPAARPAVAGPENVLEDVSHVE